MKKLLLFLLLLIPVCVFAAGGHSVSTDSITVENGQTASFTVTATNNVSYVRYTISDSTVVDIVPQTDASDWTDTSFWVESPANSTKSLAINVTGKKVGSTVITLNFDTS